MEFDYIVIGAGSAGCVVASRLSDNGRHTVLLLEAGGSDLRFWIQVPLGYGKTFYDARVNWCYDTEADPGLGGRPDYWPRGKVLGGSSSINAMVYIRGQAADYDDWEAAGNPGWGWRDVLPVYKRIEDHALGADAYRGQGGPLHITDIASQVHPLASAYLQAGQEAGLPLLADLNGATQEGVGLYQITTRDGRRLSTSRAFLRPALARRNLRLEMNAHATRILFEGGHAKGVKYRQNGRITTAGARREVILCGGAINSPQLLQLSGVGPGALLSRHGIPVVADLGAVGRNMQDHLGINYTYRSKVPSLNGALRPWWGKLLLGVQYVFLRTGPLSISLNQAGGFFRTTPDQPRPNYQLYLQALSTLISRKGERPLLHPDPYEAFSIGLSSCRTTSRGAIEIRSQDPFQHPRIVANALSTSSDVEDALNAVKFVRRIAAQPSMAAVIVEELAPGPKVVSDADLIADFRARCGTVYHPCCTCSMGADPAKTVVDARLRVHGLAGLRVVDASVFPNIISGNTNAPSIMVGMKGADLILEDAAKPQVSRLQPVQG